MKDEQKNDPRTRADSTNTNLWATIVIVGIALAVIVVITLVQVGFFNKPNIRPYLGVLNLKLESKNINYKMEMHLDDMMEESGECIYHDRIPIDPAAFTSDSQKYLLHYTIHVLPSHKGSSKIAVAEWQIHPLIEKGEERVVEMSDYERFTVFNLEDSEYIYKNDYFRAEFRWNLRPGNR